MANPMADDASLELSADTLLGGRVTLLQPVKGYRAAIDPVFLAAAVPAKAEETVLDVGVGVGAAALCLAARVADARVAGIELRRELVRLAVRNAEANGLARRVDFMVGDLVKAPRRLAPGSFHHVMANPPFIEAGRGNRSPDEGKAVSNIESSADLEDWLRFCLLMVKPKGSITLIHRADRLDQVLVALAGRLGEVLVYPLWPGPASLAGAGDKPARRIILRGRKGVATPLRLLPGLVLHEEGGGFTPRAEEVLRGGQGLEF
jgi:tRNA1(Val) A37 N6-methylase TrmN6